VDPLPRRMRYGCFAAVLLLTTLGCNFLLPSAEGKPALGIGQLIQGATQVLESAPAEPIIVAHVESSFHLYALDGTLLETRSAEGLEWARPNTAQVVGEDIFYVQDQGPEQGAVVRRVGPAQAQDLEFTRSPQGNNLAFAVSPDGARIAWSSTAWEGAAPVSQLWLADIRGEGTQRVAETDPNDEINEWFVLEPVEWLEGGDLVYAWQVTGIGGYILFYGWSSLYQYSPASDTTIAIAPVQEEVGAPCWNDLTVDGSYAVGACGPSAEVIELETASGLETTFPTLPDQGQAGAGAYSSSGVGLAYAIARGDPTEEAGQLVVRAERSQVPVSLATQSPGYFERLIWIDEQRMAVGAWAEDAASVEVVGLDGSRSPVGAGRLVGIMRRAPAMSPSQPGPCIEEQLASGDLVVEKIISTGEIAGEGVEVVVRNPGTEDITTCVPCGTVFTPSEEDSQELMVVQLTQAMVPAGGEASLTAYVICIEADEGIPDEGTAYAFTSMAQGKLGEFATCVCQDDLATSVNPLDPMAVQFAGWMIAEGGSFSELVGSDRGGALEEFLGSEAAGALAGVLELLEGPATDRLERCGIQP